MPLVQALPAYQALERVAEATCDRAGLAVADQAGVALDDGDDLGGRTGQEAFVGRVDVVARQRAFLDRDLRLARELNDGVACDAFEDPGLDRRRAQHALLD